MSTLYSDRVKESSTTTGTGNFILSGAIAGFKSFNETIGTGNLCYYCIQTTDLSAWEVGIGTLINSTTLSRNSILSSSNNNLIVNFGVGSKEVFSTLPSKFFQDIVN